MRNKFLIICCLISTALFCFTNASPTTYNFKGDLVQNKLSSVRQKRDYGTQETNLLNGVVAKRDFPDRRALDLARAKSTKSGATVYSVLQALFELLIGEKDPVAARAAMAVLQHVMPHERFSLINFVFQDPPINYDAKQFMSTFAQGGMRDSTFAVGITLALVPQPDHLLMNHGELAYLINTINSDPRSLAVGHKILQFGESFSYKGSFPTSLVAEVIVAAVAVNNGEARQASDIPIIMSQLSLP
jgi:hypothetical protein